MRALVCALLCVCFSASSFGLASAADQRAVLTLRVNTVPKQDVTVTLRDADVLVRRSDLEEAGLRGFLFNAHGDPADLVSLSTLRPDLAYHVDDVGLVLELTVTASHLASTVIDFRSRQDVSLAKPARSAFLNYSVSTSNATGAAFAGEFGTRIGAGSFTSTLSLAANQQYRSNITRWIVDSPQSDKRLTIGDVVTTTGDLGGTVSIAGVGLQRYFGLNPDTVKTALPQITGNALTPSTADIYVNGVLYRHETLPPGQFNFENLPVSQGPNNTTIVVTDSFGRQQTYSNYFYGSETMLARGLSDFSYAVGVLHSEFGEQVGHGAAAAARYSVGISDNVTGGGRLELSRGAISGGPAFSFRLAHGILGAEASVSGAGSSVGTAGLLSYQYVDPHISGGFSFTIQSPRYASLSLQPDQDRPLTNASLSIGKQFSDRMGISVSYIRQQDRENGAQSGWLVSQTSTLSNLMQLQISESLTSGPAGRQFGVQTALNFIPKNGYAASVNASESDGRTQATVQLQRSLDSQTPALGYTLSLTGGSGSVSAFASADYRGQYGNYIANLSAGAGQSNASLNVAGGLVFIGGHFFPTQSVDDSYAMVDTGGLGHVRILANGVVVGRTDKRGYMLVPRLGSYFNNDVSIAGSDTPLDYAIETETQRIAPLYRSGAIVRFGINRVQPVTGKLTVHIGKSTVIPAYGILEVESQGTTLKSDIGEGGEFYFDKLSSGVHHARAQFQGGECRFDLNVPQSASHFLKLGTVVCENGVRI
jgi:outer membrane usher protein